MTDSCIIGWLRLINFQSPWGAAIDSNSLLLPFLKKYLIKFYETNTGEDAVYRNQEAFFLSLNLPHRTALSAVQDVWNERVKLFLTFGYNEIMTGRKLCHFSMKMLVQILSFLPSYFLYNASTIAKMTDIWQVSVSIQPRQLIKVFLSMHQLSQRQKPISIDYFAD